MLTHLSLFTGIGGIDLAAEWAGFTSIGQVEWADYPTKVLEKHWPDVPRWRDIRNVSGDEVKRVSGVQSVDLISGGFPCQPFSVAKQNDGGRKGQDDERYLWPEMLRVISELKPSWVIGENVVGIISLAIDQVLSDLESIGYSCQSFIIPAASVEAIHKRDRVFIIANTNSKHKYSREIHTRTSKKCFQETQREWKEFQSFYSGAGYIQFQPSDESRICRMDDGFSKELDKDRLKALGNSVNPIQVYPILQAIADIEMGVIESAY